MASVMIAMPTYDRKVDVEVLSTIAALPGENPKHTFGFIHMTGSIIQLSRNYLTRTFLKSKEFDWLYFWDADVVIGDHTFIDKLIETAEKLDAQVVGAIYRIKAPGEKLAVSYYTDDTKTPLVSTNYKLGDITEPQLVDVIATGSMLIKRDVIETIPDPWFEFKDYPHGGVWPEDYVFCDKAREHGFKVAVDPRIETIHWGMSAWKFPSGGSRT